MASLTKPTLQNANITQRLIFNNFDSKSSFLLSRLEPFWASFAGNVNIHRNVYRQVDGLLLRALGVDSRAIFGRECSWEYFWMWVAAVESDKPHYYEHDRSPFQISSLRVPIPPQSSVHWWWYMPFMDVDSSGWGDSSMSPQPLLSTSIWQDILMRMFIKMFMDVDSRGWGAISGRKGRLFNGSLPPLLLSPLSFFCILSKNP